MAKPFRSFRFRMILLLVLSMGAAGAVTFVLYKILQSMYANVKVEDPLARIRFLIGTIGDFNFFLLIFVPLAILFFFLFTKPYAGYFRSISEHIHRLAGGEFGGQPLTIPSRDEFADIAGELNLASAKLREAVERGDFAESSKDRLVLNLAHDLRTPLTSVLGYLDFVLKDGSLTPEQARHYTTIAYTKSRRLEKLIDELFEITRMNYGMVSVRKAPFDLSELLHQLSEELYPVFENSGLVARLQLPPQLLMNGDGELLARVFENLLTNAARYGADGQYIDITGTSDEHEAVVRVVNYGGGIAAEELPHLFEMFYTGDKARTHREGQSGTGLGLFIAKNIVEQHGGSIAAESDLLRTCFEVRLPLA
ncbi:HAMP domain-containing sensor histidine kinase ['Paenibacillus yunnanensis' Narsing Rao et al. 2020]|uniref:HAMP domain-containing sensor histidine kinase n=1 Tax=Paenibacillus tengchongensis TaxID=2608684 RepID=UPI00124DD7F0|nr:HAMP domain-containing sensor histidine kinase [Paenibacillus tengchongensis]